MIAVIQLLHAATPQPGNQNRRRPLQQGRSLWMRAPQVRQWRQAQARGKDPRLHFQLARSRRCSSGLIEGQRLPASQSRSSSTTRDINEASGRWMLAAIPLPFPLPG